MKNGFAKGAMLALLAGVSLPNAALAQTADKGAGATTTAPTAGAPKVSSDDIVVTANRREETVSRAPLAITAINGANLQKVGLRDIANIDAIAPSIRLFENNTAGLVVAIRGVTTVSNSLLGDPAIAINFDDAYQARSYLTPAMLFDMERVEVLRGPQGTLYGRNATGGAVNLISRAPTTDKVGGYMTLEGGSYNLRRVEGALNVPLSDTLAARVSGLMSKRDGYIGTGLNDQDQWGARLRVKWEPSSSFRANFGLTYAHIGGRGIGDVALNAVTGKPLDPSRPWANTLYAPGRGAVDMNQLLGTARFDVDLGGATLSSISTYQRVASNSKDIVTASVKFADQFVDKQYSQEFRLVSDRAAKNAGDLSWVVGAYYFAERANRSKVNSEIDIFVPEGSPLIGRDPCTVFGFPCPSGTVLKARDFLFPVPDIIQRFTDIKADSWALFGQATYAVTDNLRVTGGLRYTDDKKSNNSVVFGIANSARTKSDNFDYKVGVEYDVTGTTLAYASVSTGYHAGGAAEGLAPASIFGPEYLTAYEAGLKTRLFDNRLSLNLAAFRYGYRDFQSSAIGPGDPTRPTTTLQLNIFNIGKVRVQGLEAEAVARITPNDRLQLSVTYVDSKITEANNIPGNAIECACNNQFGGFLPLGTHNGPIVISELKGSSLTQAPRWSANVSYTRTFQLGGGDTLEFFLQSRLSTSYFASNAQVPEIIKLTRQDGYTRTDLTATYRIDKLGLSLSAYVQNIENDAQKTFVFLFPAFTAQLTPPRTYGARLNWTF